MRKVVRALPAAQTTICSGDGKVCASRDSADSRILLTEASTGKTLRVIAVSDLLSGYFMALNQDGSQIAYGYAASPLFSFTVWDTTTGRRQFQRRSAFQDAGVKVVALAYSQDNHSLAAMMSNGIAEVWDTARWNIRDTKEGFRLSPSALEFSDGHQLIASYGSGAGQCWSVGTDKIATCAGRSVVKAKSEPVVFTASAFANPAAFELTPNGQLLIPGAPNRVFDLQRGSLDRIFHTNPSGEDELSSIDTTNPTVFAFAGPLTSYLVDPATLQPINTAHWDSGGAIAVSRDGKLVALRRDTHLAIVAQQDHSERVWDIGHSFERITFSDDGKAVILYGSPHGMGDFAGITAIDVATGNPVWLPKLWARSDAVSSDMRYAAQTTNAQVRIFDLKRRCAIYELPLWSEAATFSPDGSQLALHLQSGRIDVLDVATGTRVAALSGFPGDIVARVRFDPRNHQLLAAGLNSGTVKMWNLTDQSELATIVIHENSWVVITPSGFYDGSDDGMKDLYLVRGVTTEPLTAEAADHHVAGLMKSIWSGTPPAPSGNIDSGLSDSDLPLLSAASAPESSAQDTVATLKVRLDRQPEGAFLVLGTRNGVPFDVSPVASQHGTYEAEIKMADGSNRFVFWVQDDAGHNSAELVETRTAKRTDKPVPEIVPGTASSSVEQLAFAHDGTLLATTSSHAVTLWDMRTRRQLRTISGHADHITQLEFGATSDLLVSLSGDHTLRMWDTRTGEERCRISLLTQYDFLSKFALSPDGTHVAVYDSDARLARIFRTADCVEEQSFESGFAEPAWAGNRAIWVRAAGDAKDRLVKIDLTTNTETRIAAGGEVRSFTILADQRVLVLLDDGTLRFQSGATAFEPFAPAPIQGKVDFVKALSSGRLLIESKGTSLLFAPNLTSVVNTWKTGFLNSAAVSVDERWAAFADTLGNLSLYNLTAASREELPLSAGYGTVTRLVFSPDGGVLAAAHQGSDGSRLLFWDVATSSIIRTVDPPNSASTTSWFLNSTFDRIGATLASMQEATPVLALDTYPLTFAVQRGQTGQLKVTKFDLDSTHPTHAVLPTVQTPASLLAGGLWPVSGSGSEVPVSGRVVSELRVVDLATGKDLSRFRPHPGTVSGAALSDDGTLLLTYGDGEEGNSVRLWQKSGAPVWRIEGQAVSAMAISRENKLAAIAGAGRIVVVDAAVGHLVKLMAMEPPP